MIKLKFLLIIIIIAVGFSGVLAENPRNIEVLEKPGPIAGSILKQADSICTLQKHNDIGYGFYLGYQTGERVMTYFDPVECGDPTYPFAINGLSFTLFGPTGSVWPVNLDIIIYDTDTSHWVCNGPTTELCRFQISCDSATWSLPYYGTYDFPEACCVTGPFYIGIEYSDPGPGQFPSIVLDTNSHPDTCDNWIYIDNNWWEFYDIWLPDPFYPLFWVHGESHSTDCCPDNDLDEICDWTDNCPETNNPLQEDADSDGVGDACDICPVMMTWPITTAMVSPTVATIARRRPTPVRTTMIATG